MKEIKEPRSTIAFSFFQESQIVIFPFFSWNHRLCLSHKKSFASHESTTMLLVETHDVFSLFLVEAQLHFSALRSITALLRKHRLCHSLFSVKAQLCLFPFGCFRRKQSFASHSCAFPFLGSTHVFPAEAHVMLFPEKH